MTRALLLACALLVAGCAAQPARTAAVDMAPAESSLFVRYRPRVRPSGWVPPEKLTLRNSKGVGVTVKLIRSELDKLGITVGGVYTPPSPSLTPWTEDVNAAGYSLLNAATIDGGTGSLTLKAPSGETIEFMVDGANSAYVAGAGIVMPSGKVLAFGGTTSTQPAFRYGGSAGVIEFLRADGTAGKVRLLATHSTGVTVEAPAGNYFQMSDAGFQFSADDGDTEVAASSEQLSLFGKTGISIGVNGSGVVDVVPGGLTLATGKVLTSAAGTDTTVRAPSPASGNGRSANLDGGDAVSAGDGGAARLRGGEAVGSGAIGGDAIVSAGSTDSAGGDDEGGTVTITPGTGTIPGRVRLRDAEGNDVAVVGSGASLALVGAGSLALKDQTSAPTAPAGYGDVYVHNEAGRQSARFAAAEGAGTIGWALGPVVVSAQRITSNETLTDAGTDSVIDWNGEIADPYGFHATGAGSEKFTCPPGLGGLYELSYAVRLDCTAPGAGDYLQVYALRNGVTLGSAGGSPYLAVTGAFLGTINPYCGSFTMRLANGDYVSLAVDSDEVGDLSLIAGSQVTLKRIGD